MGQDGHFTKRDPFKASKTALYDFFERGFYWISLFVITLIILCILFFF